MKIYCLKIEFESGLLKDQVWEYRNINILHCIDIFTSLSFRAKLESKIHLIDLVGNTEIAIFSLEDLYSLLI